MTAEDLAIAQHEAGHLVAARCQGLEVRLATRATSDPSRVLGFVQLPSLFDDLDEDRARRIVKMLLAASATSDAPLPTWPIGQNSIWRSTLDEKLIRILCEDYLKLDEVGYGALCDETWDLVFEERFQRLFVAITAWFEHSSVLDERMITEAERIAWR